MARSSEPTVMPLVEAALRLRIPYARAWAIMLAGQLEGERIERRWFVSLGSVEAVERAAIRRARGKPGAKVAA